MLEEAQRDLVALPGVGMSVLEISHRSKTFEDILARTEADLRTLGNIPASHKVLFLQGGASLQFSMVPMNLLTTGATADYIVTGGWAQKAVKEAQRVGTVNIAASTESENFARIPRQDELTADARRRVRALHDEQHDLRHRVEERARGRRCAARRATRRPTCSAGRSTSRRYGLIYAGAQKNLGPSGVTLVIIREDLLARSAKSLPTMLNYAVHAENGSMYNTPPCFGIYLMGLVAKWALGAGRTAGDGQRATSARPASSTPRSIARASIAAPPRRTSRSLMNVTFRLPSEELEKAFVKESTAAGLDGLKGHRSVGGMRASIYNAFPEEGVDALVEFMQEFEKKHGVSGARQFWLRPIRAAAPRPRRRRPRRRATDAAVRRRGFAASAGQRRRSPR